MAFCQLLLTIIDDLIQRIDKVEVCRTQLRLIATSLIRLKHTLNDLFMVKYTTHLYEDIQQTLIAIDVVVTSCNEKEVDLNGITYRGLESLLLRLHICLTQHEADLTDDYERKLQILTNAYYEQQILVQKVFDETIRRRLETMEQNTKEYTAQQLHLLREMHFNTIKGYLRNCTELHKSVPLTGLTGDIVAKVAHRYYHISSEHQLQLEHEWQSCDLPLTRTFIQFKPDKSTSFERNESRRLLLEPGPNVLQGLHNRKEASKGIWERLVSAPYMMSIAERDRYTEEKDISEENIIRTKRWIVILGDPGSGKTSFARWLVRHLAQTLLLNGQHSTDYGPLRIPILIRIGELAEVLKGQPSLTLFDYIGKHKWMGKNLVDDASISLGDLSCALQDYIKHGQALIILDGLDEIPVSDQRSKIINIVENFVDAYVQTPSGTSVFDNPHLSRLLDDPSKSGGNQLIVTSRIVGYHAAPLAGQFAHYTIRPMDMERMNDFVDYWFFRVHQQILDTLDLSVPNQGENHGKALKEELEKTENVGLLDVASNSCLMSFICTVAFSQLEGSPLPIQRILLYEQIVNSMLTLWSSKNSTIPIPELIRILSNIATYIHEHSASGLIHEEKMKELCIQTIKDSARRNVYLEQDIDEVEHRACEFVRIIREDVGILAARGESLYGFLHLTFQEYFTCLKLINTDKLEEKKVIDQETCSNNEIQLVAQSIRHHMNDPRFRVPIALALGKISSIWSHKDFDNFCLEFIEEKDKYNALLPIGAYMLISHSNDIVKYPSDVVLFNVLDCLIIAAGQHRWPVVCPFLIDQMRTALKKLRNDIISLWINNFLIRFSSHDIQTISVLCQLIEGKPHEFENIKWLNQSSCSMLQSLSILDNENKEFAIDRLLVKIAFKNHRLLPVHPSTFKGFLLGEEIELHLIPFALFPLIIILYGGLKRDGQTVIFNPWYIYRESTAVTPILIHFLSRKERDVGDRTIILIKQECLRSLLTRIQNHDESSEAMDLCIATICLLGIDCTLTKKKIVSTPLFRMSMNRLNYISMILRQYYFVADENDRSVEQETTKFALNIIEKDQLNELSKRQFLNLLNSLTTSMARLRSSTKSLLLEGKSAPDKRVTLYLPNALRVEYDFLNHLLSSDIEIQPGRMSCSLVPYFTKLFWILEHNDDFEGQYRMAVAMDTIPEYLFFRNEDDLLFPLTFVPSHLRNLYVRLLKQRSIIINSNDFAANEKSYLFFGHILIECLMTLSNSSCKLLSILSTLVVLSPMIRMNYLENFSSSLLWMLDPRDSSALNTFENVNQRPMNYGTGQYVNKIKKFPVGYDMTDEGRRKVIEKSIEQEHQRLQHALIENDETSMKLYSACISLARVCRWAQGESRLCLLKESLQGAMSIKNTLARLDALCVIAFYFHTDFDEIKVYTGRSIHEEIQSQLNDIYSDLSLLLLTAIFIRCLPLLQDPQTIDKCLQNILNKFANADQEDQQVVYEALSPYLQSNPIFHSVIEYASHTFPEYNQIIRNKSSVLNENLSSSLLFSNMYLVELASDIHKYVLADDLRLLVSHSDSYTTMPFQFDNPTLTLVQAIAITNNLYSISSRNQTSQLKNSCTALSDTLDHFNLVEFKACRLIESWMKWKDSNELSSFAYHAALLLINSDFWSVKAITIVSDLLRCENDRFRQRAEMILRSKSEYDTRTSARLGIDVLLTLIAKKARYQHSSPFAALTLNRMSTNIMIDIQSDLETFLWLERYRLYSLVNREYSFDKSKLPSISHITSYISNDIRTDVSFCDNIRLLSSDLIQYMCELIKSSFSSFMEIDGDTTSNPVVESHVQFVVSAVVLFGTIFNHSDDTRELAVDALEILLETSDNDEIRRAAASILGYICHKNTYKTLFNKLQIIVEAKTDELKYTDYVVCALIGSYCYCISIRDIDFDDDNIDLFRKLLKHSSENVFKTARTGLGRVLKDRSLLIEMLDSDYIHCYHALMASTADAFLHDNWQNSVDAVAEFIEKYPDLLSIFIIELYNSIRHFTNDVIHVKTIDNYLVYGHQRYVEAAASLAIRMPAAFCAFIKDWHDGNNLKRALFYTSKQHNYPQRAACLTILSMFGELTVELCEILVEALYDDQHIQNTCYKCLNRIVSIKDDKAVVDLLFSYLKSKSMNVRYVAAKMLLHLSKSSLIPSNQVQTVLNNLMVDPSSNEDLWLNEERDNIQTGGVYYYSGPLKDVIYSLLVQHLTGDIGETIRRTKLNDIDEDFVESEAAARLASCLYEAKTAENTVVNTFSTAKVIE